MFSDACFWSLALLILQPIACTRIQWGPADCAYNDITCQKTRVAVLGAGVAGITTAVGTYIVDSSASD
jgi:hypothetical protein